jgi:hypothetical protein
MVEKDDNAFAINLILKGAVRAQFKEIKSCLGVEEPNTRILEKCIESTYKQLVG